MRNEHLRTAIWFVALILLGAWMASGWLRFHPAERFSWPETPFDRTSGLKEGYWRFLEQVRDVLPDKARYTILAETSDEEMKLYMIAAGVLVRQEGVAATYYGVPNPAVVSVRWIASYKCAVVPPDSAIVARLRDGCVCERAE